jgi:hypothetical protein
VRQRLHRPALGVQIEYAVGRAHLMTQIGEAAPQPLVVERYQRAVEIVTRGALRQMLLPGLVAVGTPIAVGLVFKQFGVGADSLPPPAGPHSPQSTSSGEMIRPRRNQNNVGRC